MDFRQWISTNALMLEMTTDQKEVKNAALDAFKGWLEDNVLAIAEKGFEPSSSSISELKARTTGSWVEVDEKTKVPRLIRGKFNKVSFFMNDVDEKKWKVSVKFSPITLEVDAIDISRSGHDDISWRKKGFLGEAKGDYYDRYKIPYKSPTKDQATVIKGLPETGKVTDAERQKVQGLLDLIDSHCLAVQELVDQANTIIKGPIGGAVKELQDYISRIKDVAEKISVEKLVFAYLDKKGNSTISYKDVYESMKSELNDATMAIVDKIVVDLKKAATEKYTGEKDAFVMERENVSESVTAIISKIRSGVRSVVTWLRKAVDSVGEAKAANAFNMAVAKSRFNMANVEKIVNQLAAGRF